MSINPEAKEEKVNGNRGLLSEKEAAEYIGVCRLTLMRLRQRQRLGFFRVGTRILYSIEEHIRPFLAVDEQRPPYRRAGARRAKRRRA